MNAILSNSIYDNAGLGIDLNGGLGSGLAGNNLQPAPALTWAAASANAIALTGRLDARPDTAYTLQFFAGSAGGVGRSLLGTLAVTTDATGTATFSFRAAAPSVAAGIVAATATDPAGDTSEFSAGLPTIAATAPRVASLGATTSRARLTALVLTFTGPMATATAQDLRNYRLSGPDGARIRIRTAAYDPQAWTVTIVPRERLGRHELLCLTVVGRPPGGLTDLLGQPLDGAGTGRPGSNYRRMATAARLVAGPASSSHLPGDRNRGRQARGPASSSPGHHSPQPNLVPVHFS